MQQLVLDIGLGTSPTLANFFGGPNAAALQHVQQAVVDTMQTREELYDRIGYHAFERKLDALFAAKK